MISIPSVVILHDIYLRTIKVRSSSGSINEYVRLVEAYRDNGKVKQRTLADLGRKDLLVEILPKLQRFLGGDRADAGEAEDPDILDASTWGPVLAVRALFDQLGLWTILDAALGKEMSGNNLKVSGIINLPSLGSLRGKLLCPEQYIEGFASVPVGIVENRPRVPLLNSIEPSIGWSHPLTKKGDACSLPTWQANLVEEPSNT